jgi:hypothetical protein
MPFNPDYKESESRYGTSELFYKILGAVLHQAGDDLVVGHPVGVRDYRQSKDNLITEEQLSAAMTGYEAAMQVKESLLLDEDDESDLSANASVGRVESLNSLSAESLDSDFEDEWVEVATDEDPLTDSWVVSKYEEESIDPRLKTPSYLNAIFVPLTLKSQDKKIALFYPCADGTAGKSVAGEKTLQEVLLALDGVPVLETFDKLIIPLSQTGTHWISMVVTKGEDELLNVQFIDTRTYNFTLFQGLFTFNGETRHFNHLLAETMRPNERQLWQVFDKFITGEPAKDFSVKRFNTGTQWLTDSINCGPYQGRIIEDLIFSRDLNMSQLADNQRLYDALCYHYAISTPIYQKVRRDMGWEQGLNMSFKLFKGIDISMQRLHTYGLMVLNRLKASIQDDKSQFFEEISHIFRRIEGCDIIPFDQVLDRLQIYFEELDDNLKQIFTVFSDLLKVHAQLNDIKFSSEFFEKKDVSASFLESSCDPMR